MGSCCNLPNIRWILTMWIAYCKYGIMFVVAYSSACGMPFELGVAGWTEFFWIVPVRFGDFRSSWQLRSGVEEDAACIMSAIRLISFLSGFSGLYCTLSADGTLFLPCDASLLRTLIASRFATTDDLLKRKAHIHTLVKNCPESCY